MPKAFKQALIFLIVFLFVEFGLFQFASGKSGGDLFFAFFSIALLILATLISGALTFNWEFKDKLGIILGLAVCYGAFALIASIML